MKKLKLLFESARLGIETLWQNKFRSFLTILGVFIGVVIITSVASVLNGFRADVVSQVEDFGTNSIYITRFPLINMGRKSSQVRNRKELSLLDSQAVEAHCPSIESVSPYLSRGGSMTAKYRQNSMENPELRGTFANVFRSSDMDIEEGRGFTDSENDHRASVALIGDGIREALFPGIRAVGKDMVVGGKKLRIIGTMAKKKEGPFGSANPEDRVVLVPYYTFRKMFPRSTDHFITATAYPGKRNAAMSEIEEILRIRRKVPIMEENNFELGTADSIIETFDKIVAGALAVMFMLSSVAFMVGGVGVMNIMLVSVTERTREIGIRKAIGARKRDILTQFLTEAAVLTGMGGLLGMVFAELLLKAVDGAVDQIHAVTPLWARLFAILGSMIIGIVFGLWPALKASRLDPIEALRYE